MPSLIGRLLIISLVVCSSFFGCDQTELCRHEAFMAALIWTNNTGEETVIVVGPSKVNDRLHAQARIRYCKGKDCWLHKNVGSYRTEQDRFFEPRCVVCLDEWFAFLYKGIDPKIVPFTW